MQAGLQSAGLRLKLCCSQSRNSRVSLVLQHAHDHPPILRLSFPGLIVADRPTLTHRSWSQDSGERNLTLLKQDRFRPTHAREICVTLFVRSSLSFWFRVTLPNAEA